jgi:hypothetical protein
MTELHEPRASRPRFPQGYEVPTDESNLLPWSHARSRLEQAQNYWVCTATTEGKPHAAPLWGAWVDDRLYFEGSPATRWGRNLAANPQAIVHLESGSDVVIVEGAILDEDDVGEALAERIAASFAVRYNGYRTQSRGFFILVPRVSFAWSRFPHDATRWVFGEPSNGA